MRARRFHRTPPLVFRRKGIPKLPCLRRSHNIFRRCFVACPGLWPVVYLLPPGGRKHANQISLVWIAVALMFVTARARILKSHHHERSHSRRTGRVIERRRRRRPRWKDRIGLRYAPTSRNRTHRSTPAAKTRDAGPDQTRTATLYQERQPCHVLSQTAPKQLQEFSRRGFSTTVARCNTIR